MRRRAFLVLLGPAVVVRPDMVLAQSSDRVRRIGLLMPFAENDSEGALRLAAWLQRLKELGWEDGRNLRIEYRWAAGSADRTRTFAKELVELQPDLLIGGNTTTVATLVREMRKIPIVFVQVADPVGSGLVQSLARPGGNVTGCCFVWVVPRDEPGPPGSSTRRLKQEKTLCLDSTIDRVEVRNSAGMSSLLT